VREGSQFLKKERFTAGILIIVKGRETGLRGERGREHRDSDRSLQEVKRRAWAVIKGVRRKARL